MRSRTAAATAAAATAALAITTLASSPAQAVNPNNSKKMTQAVTVDNVHEHLEQLQAIADANDGNRGAGTSGYEASARYVEQTLRDAGYTTERQNFSFIYEEVHTSSLEEISPTRAPSTACRCPTASRRPRRGSPPSSRHRPPRSAAPTATTPAADVVDKIALVSRGECSFAQKAVAAKAHAAPTP